MKNRKEIESAYDAIEDRIFDRATSLLGDDWYALHTGEYSPLLEEALTAVSDRLDGLGDALHDYFPTELDRESGRCATRYLVYQYMAVQMLRIARETYLDREIAALPSDLKLDLAAIDPVINPIQDL